MEDDKIRDLLNNFQPEISSSFRFMSNLEKNIDRFEILKQHDRALKKRSKIAVVIAAFSGFTMGIILNILFPLIGDWIASFSILLPQLKVWNLSIDYTFITWIILAGVSIITAINVYELVLAKLSPKETFL